MDWVSLMPDNDATAVAQLLLEISQRLLLAGEGPYRARAYARAAENLLTLTIPLQDVIAQGRLREIPGVGAALAEVIRTLHQHGRRRGWRPCGPTCPRAYSNS